MRLNLDLHDCKSLVLASLRIIAFVVRRLAFTPYSCQPFRATGSAPSRVSPAELKVITAITSKAFVRRDAHFVGDEDMAPIGDDDGPKDGHRGAHDCEVDFEAGDDEYFRVPLIGY